MASIVERGDLIRKVYFPRMIIVIATSLSSLITLAFNLIVVAVFVIFSGAGLQLTAPLFLLLVLELYALTLGSSFFLAALYLKFADFNYFWRPGLRWLSSPTPSIYPFPFFRPRTQPPFA